MKKGKLAEEHVDAVFQEVAKAMRVEANAQRKPTLTQPILPEELKRRMVSLRPRIFKDPVTKKTMIERQSRAYPELDKLFPPEILTEQPHQGKTK